MKCAALKVTDYERAIIVLLARGYAPKQIAAALGMTTNTVCQARRRVLNRNGITNDTQLGMLIERCQFVSVYERNLIEDRREERLSNPCST
jgi:DNA-binding NarL/FixJ family response regulator